MKIKALLFIYAVAFHSVGLAESANELMQRNYETVRVSASSFKAEIELIAPNGQIRKRQTKNLTQLSNGSNSRLTRFLAPSDVKGTATLLIENDSAEDDMWIYLPALKKVRRLVASNNRDSFVGTDFTFGDILGHKVRDWNHRIVTESVSGDKKCIQIESTPVSNDVRSKTGYSKRLSCIDPNSAVSLKTEYWDEFGKPLKLIEATDVVRVDPVGRWQPMLLRAKNIQSNNQTILRIVDYTIEKSLGPDKFRPNRLELPD